MPRQHENDPNMRTVQQQLNEMNRSVGALQQVVTHMTDTWRSQEQVATEGRRLMHSKMDMLKEGVAGLTGRVDNMAGELSALKPAVQEFKDEKLRDEGAKRLGKYLWGGMLTAAGFGGWGIHELLGFMSHRPPTP